MAGRVERIGKDVKQFQPGDKIFGISNFGAFAEYRCVKEDKLIRKPPNLSFDEAATLPIAGITALQGLRVRGSIRSGQKVLINGASGDVGTFAVQIAKSFGAEVTGVCSTKKLELIQSIGADHVIDYTKEDFTKMEQHYDLIFAVGGNRSILDYQRALRPEGIYVCARGAMSQYFQALLLGPLFSLMGNKQMGIVFPIPNQKDLAYLIKLSETRKVVPVIDRRYCLMNTAEAIQYVEDGQVRGKLIIALLDDNLNHPWNFVFLTNNHKIGYIMSIRSVVFIAQHEKFSG